MKFFVARVNVSISLMIRRYVSTQSANRCLNMASIQSNFQPKVLNMASHELTGVLWPCGLV
jgi:hypothetical protein